MVISVADHLRYVVAVIAPMALLAPPEGDVVKKFVEKPKVKPPRRTPSTTNKSNRSDYMKNYMENYRGEEGKDYQKVPDKVKEWRREQKKKIENP